LPHKYRYNTAETQEVEINYAGWQEDRMLKDKAQDGRKIGSSRQTGNKKTERRRKAH
jgi:hypothetical protein